MKDEVRGFIFLTLAVICFCTHQLCNKLFWVAISSYAVQPASNSISYGGTALFLSAAVFFICAILFFIKAIAVTVKKKLPGSR